VRGELVPVVADHLVASGVSGVFLNGTTGEGMSLTADERCKLVEAWVESAKGRLEIIVHVGAQSVREAAALAEHAASAGVDGIAAVTPVFHKPETVGDLVDWLALVAGAASETPFWYYHLPGITGVRLRASDVVIESMRRIPSFCGVKYTEADLSDYQRCVLVADGRVEIAFGVDELLLSGLALGAKTAVGSTYNYAAPIYLAIIEAFDRGDLDSARRLMHRVGQMVDTLIDHGVLAAGKAMMLRHGIDIGPPRPPVRALSAEQRQTLIEGVDALGVFDLSAAS